MKNLRYKNRNGAVEKAPLGSIELREDIWSFKAIVPDGT